MNGCVYRTADNQCQKYSDPIRNTMSWCVGNEPCEGRTPSNADRIRAMDDLELAETFYTGCENRAYNDACHVTQELIERSDLTMSDEEQDEICLKCWLDWLKSPVEVDNGT